MGKGRKTKQITKSRTSPTFRRGIKNIALHELYSSYENQDVYRPVDPKDPTIKELARNIKEKGVLEPLVIASDYYVISGHRRRVAAILANRETVPCRIMNIKHNDPRFLDLLVSHNKQRIKNPAEQLREAVINADPDEAYDNLIDFRRQQAEIKVETIDVEERGKRKSISGLKLEMVEAVTKLVFGYFDYWPLSDRQIHYQLLNDPPLKNTNHPDSAYKNDLASYKNLCDLLVRLRLDHSIPMEAIADPTRPVEVWSVHNNPQDFTNDELGSFLKGYWRNLQQSQPLHIELVAEKMTLQGIIRPVCAQYTIPYTIGRGYNSLPPRWEIVKRFEKSGKEKLCLLVLADFDTEGIDIGESMLQSIREDFFQFDAEAVRVGLNPEHIERFGLADNPGEIKESSSRYKKFVRRYGKNVYELEALSPEQLQTILTEAIDSVIDVDLFNTEISSEKSDAAYLQSVREKIYRDMSGYITEQ